MPLKSLSPINAMNLDPNGCCLCLSLTSAKKSLLPCLECLFSTSIHSPNSGSFSLLLEPMESPSDLPSFDTSTSVVSLPLATVEFGSVSTIEHIPLMWPYLPQVKQTVGRASYSTHWMALPTNTYEIKGFSRFI
ncbi:hypothetical protein ES288_A13G134600v1 [Gossypium darwinii]|uniref:Uncharacterized protein n=1 Tax=Gossypium darwinii TaxID=34276 RepID=A0A5D2DZJ3_GOSDA|nr:hypothetical protein ES288_A13G134600v1 [Gossypium darwinii]